MNIVLHAQLIALLTNYVFQFGNEMLLTSFYASSLLSVLVIVKMEEKIEGSVKNLIARCLIKVGKNFFNFKFFQRHLLYVNFSRCQRKVL